MVILRCDREKILPVYLYHFLRSPSFHEQVNSLRSGVAQPQLPIRDMRRIKLPLPTMPEQKRISGILSAYDELIENSQQRIKILESMARALYREWFVHFRFPGHEKVTFVSSPLGKIPEGWEVKKLKNVCRLTMGQSPKSEFYNEMGEGQPFHQGVTNFGNRFPTDRLFCTVEGRIAEAGDSLLSDKVDAAKGNDVVLCHLLATNLGLAISTLTLDVMRFDNNDIHGGTRERRDREALFDAFAKLAPNAGLSVEPVFLPGLCELVARFINASAAASQVTRCLDHLTRQRVLPDYTKAAGAVDQVFGDRTLKLARDVLHFISRESRLPIDIFKASLS